MLFDNDPALQQVIQAAYHAASSPPSAPSGGSSGGSSGGGGSGQNPNPYDIKNDVVYQQAVADEQAALAAAASQRDAAINQALVQFGNVPDFASIAKSLGLSQDQINAITGSLNPETGSLADQYTKSGNSVLAQLNQAHDQALSQLRANLAAHGTLESGATGVGAGLENQSYQHGLSNAYQTLLSNLLGYESNYTNSANSARTALENAASSAYDRAVQMASQLPPPTTHTTTSSPAAAPPAGTRPSDVASSSLAAFNNSGGVSNPYSALAARSAGLNALYGLGATKPRANVSNAYTTGQKRFG